ncbi:MAG: hypothetical protein GDA45_07180 [Chromatiales bacterium]|nr:hypothetical protein [Chromatiales bacterium]
MIAASSFLNTQSRVFFALLAVVYFTTDAIANRLPRSGDVRDGYESTNYVTRSESLKERAGTAIDLYEAANTPQLGIPPTTHSLDNPLNRAGIELGRRLFFDRRLSINDTMSCAICHVPEMGFAHNELEISVGVEGRSARRNAPTILNVAYKNMLFHDGRETTLENQVWIPMLARNEMANPSIGYVIQKLNNLKDYDGLFEKAFNRSASMETIGMALAQYQRTLISANSRFDRWYYGGEKDLLTEQEQLGFEIFMGKGMCSTCHLVGEEYALFTDNLLHNTGFGYDIAMASEPPTYRVQLAPGTFVDVKKELIDSVSQDRGIKRNDLGRYEVTENPDDLWKYLTPTLRNIALTAPYMHNGKLASLEEVIEFYDQGGIANMRLSPLIKKLALQPDEKTALVSFLKTLTGANVVELAGDAFAAPVGDVQ